ncbi:hypothetical protein K0651_06040 [Ornithinimicrobium sp. Arc0846-15]|nr:hypothetical protein [Ornithinimicrobium laminariae]
MANRQVTTVPRIFDDEFEPLADELLRSYFSNADGGSSGFTGSHFETLSGVWDAAETSNVITAGDLAAVSCLSVNIPGRAAVRILQSQADEITALLAAMPNVTKPLWATADEDLTSKSAAAQELWKLLRSGGDGMGPVTTSKLMARKRAHLIPIYDTVVASALKRSNSAGFWATVRPLMQAEVDGLPLHSRLANSAARVGLPKAVTPLRVFDVVVWYSHNPRQRSSVDAIQERLIENGMMKKRWRPS